MAKMTVSEKIEQLTSQICARLKAPTSLEERDAIREILRPAIQRIADLTTCGCGQPSANGTGGNCWDCEQGIKASMS